MIYFIVNKIFCDFLLIKSCNIIPDFKLIIDYYTTEFDLYFTLTLRNERLLGSPYAISLSLFVFIHSADHHQILMTHLAVNRTANECFLWGRQLVSVTTVDCSAN